MKGGSDMMYELRTLAVPFGLMLAKNGMEYLKSKSQEKKRAPKKPAAPKSKKKTQKGGCGCASAKLGGQAKSTTGGSSCGYKSTTNSSATTMGGSSCGYKSTTNAGALGGGNASVSQQLNELSHSLNSLVKSYGGRS